MRHALNLFQVALYLGLAWAIGGYWGALLVFFAGWTAAFTLAGWLSA